MEITEEEAIKNLNDVSGLWYSADCVDINLKSLSNNLINMSSEETNYSRAKQLKYQGRKSQDLKRPMSQQRQSSAVSQRQRHSFSIYQDNSFLYDFQNNNQKNVSNSKQNAKQINTNEALNYSSSQCQSSIEHSSRSSYQQDLSTQQATKFIKNNCPKPNDFLNCITAQQGSQQTKREYQENYQKMREKDRQSKEQQQFFVVYGNSNPVDSANVQNDGRVILSCIKNRNQEKQNQEQQIRQFQCRTSVNIGENFCISNNNSDAKNNVQNQKQASKNKVFYSSQTNFNSQKQKQIQNQFIPSKTAANYYQKVLVKQQNSNKQNESINNNQLQINQKENINQITIQSIQQKDEIHAQTNKPQMTSFKANELIENCPQFLVKLKSRFSRAPSFYRKNTPVKNLITQQNNNNNNLSLNSSRNDLVVGNVLNPKNMYNQPNTQNQDQQQQQQLQNSFYSSNPKLSFLQIVPTQLSHSVNKNNNSKVQLK